MPGNAAEEEKRRWLEKDEAGMVAYERQKVTCITSAIILKVHDTKI